MVGFWKAHKHRRLPVAPHQLGKDDAPVVGVSDGLIGELPGADPFHKMFWEFVWPETDGPYEAGNICRMPFTHAPIVPPPATALDGFDVRE